MVDGQHKSGHWKYFGQKPDNMQRWEGMDQDAEEVQAPRRNEGCKEPDS